MKKDEFRYFTESHIRLLDGATGSFLLAAGAPRGACLEKWACDNPDVVIGLQNEYIEAGSGIILAPTFGANRFRLKAHGLEGETLELNKKAVGISRRAAAGRALVAGDVSMLGEMMEPFGDLTFEEAQDAYREQISALNDAGCDLLVIETMINIDELKAALRASKEVSDLPVLATMSFGASGKTIYGTSAEEAARIITDEGADAVGANCSLGPDLMLTVIESIAANTHLPVIAKPNAGLPNREGKYELSADAFAGQAARLADAGASLIGGCCGTSPEYIRKLAALIDR